MSRTNEGGPAFPRPSVPDPNNSEELLTIGHSGMTLRDWMAGMAMQAIGSNPATGENLMKNIQPQDTEKVVAHMAYKMADAMLAERSKP